MVKGQISHRLATTHSQRLGLFFDLFFLTTYPYRQKGQITSSLLIPPIPLSLRTNPIVLYITHDSFIYLWSFSLFSSCLFELLLFADSPPLPLPDELLRLLPSIDLHSPLLLLYPHLKICLLQLELPLNGPNLAENTLPTVLVD
jgi:hypothetical protein